MEKSSYRSWLPYVAAAGASYLGISKGKGSTKAVNKPVRIPPAKKKRVYKARRQNLRYLKGVAGELKDLKTKVDRGRGVLRFRCRFTAELLCAASLSNKLTVHTMSTSDIEVPLQQLRVFNPSSPGTYISMDFTSGTQMKEVEISLLKTVVTGRNNYNVPVTVTLYLCVPKNDTSIAPLTAYTNGLSQVSDGSLNETNPMFKPWDSPQFRDLWYIKKTLKKTLQPGDEIYMEYKAKTPFTYDPSFVDSHGLIFQERYSCHAYLVNIDGPIAHDSVTTTLTGVSQAKIDFLLERHIDVRYDAGADIEYCITSNVPDTIVNNAIVGLPNNATGEVFSITL